MNGFHADRPLSLICGLLNMFCIYVQCVWLSFDSFYIILFRETIACMYPQPFVYWCFIKQNVLLSVNIVAGIVSDIVVGECVSSQGSKEKMWLCFLNSTFSGFVERALS